MSDCDNDQAEKKLNILALEPYYGGSHKHFLEGWMNHSVHHWQIVHHPAYHWKWRMRHSSYTLAQDVQQKLKIQLEDIDIVFASSMLNLTEFKSFCPALADRPSVLYFHENQLTYPLAAHEKRDHHYALNEFFSALQATECWYNSQYHLDEHHHALSQWLQRMPPPNNWQREMDLLKRKSKVMHPGIAWSAPETDGPHPMNQNTRRHEQKKTDTLRIVWPFRWEHDKGCDILAQVLEVLVKKNLRFKVTVCGQAHHQTPQSLSELQTRFPDHIENLGFQSKLEYFESLRQADLLLSTARHEFFGIAVMEAAASGCDLLLPKSLAYPELYQHLDKVHFYDGSIAHLIQQLEPCFLIDCITTKNHDLAAYGRTFSWKQRFLSFDRALSSIAKSFC